LKENAEYHMAKDDQKVLLARQAEFQADLMRAKATDFTEAPSDSVGIGTIVDLKDSVSGNKIKYTFLVHGMVILKIISFPTLHRLLRKYLVRK
jgi:transcription elongation GreA/GreB family factor